VGYSPDKELVEYFISIIHVFSSRVYGLRKYGKVLKDDGLQD
jgi:predicted site-specific integrase-resolvase